MPFYFQVSDASIVLTSFRRINEGRCTRLIPLLLKAERLFLKAKRVCSTWSCHERAYNNAAWNDATTQSGTDNVQLTRTKMWEIFKSLIVIGRMARCVTLVQRMSVICQISKWETHDNQPRVRKSWWMRVLWCHFMSGSKRARAAMKCYKVDLRSLDIYIYIYIYIYISRSLTEKINVFEIRVLNVGLLADERHFWKEFLDVSSLWSSSFLISNLLGLQEFNDLIDLLNRRFNFAACHRREAHETFTGKASTLMNSGKWR